MKNVSKTSIKKLIWITFVETTAKYANLPKINKIENLHVQSDDNMYESAESDHKVQVASSSCRECKTIARQTYNQTNRFLWVSSYACNGKVNERL